MADKNDETEMSPEEFLSKHVISDVAGDVQKLRGCNCCNDEFTCNCGLKYERYKYCPGCGRPRWCEK